MLQVEVAPSRQAANDLNRRDWHEQLSCYTPLEERFNEPIPPTRHLLHKFCDDLKRAFVDAGERTKTLRLGPYRFEVWWRGTKGDPVDPPLRGWVYIAGETVEMKELQTSGKIVSAVMIGNVKDFPSESSILYYCPADDMLYYFPVDSPSPRKSKLRYVYAWYTLAEILDERVGVVGSS